MKLLRRRRGRSVSAAYRWRMKVLALTPDASQLLQLLANEIERDLDIVIEPSLRAGLELVDSARWSLIFVDSILSDRVVDIVEQIAMGGHRVVLLARSPSVEQVIDALRRGVWDLLRLPISVAELRDVMARSRAAGTPVAPSSGPSSVTLVGDSPEFSTTRELAIRVADSTASVLIVGERGTGKETLARFLHDRSCRRRRPFVAVDCAATPEGELFGDETGGGLAHRTGLLELANGGTLFLDEIVDLPLSVQSKILRAIRERRITRVGGHKPVAIDVRVVAGTTHRPEDRVAEGRLREDLYYQVAIVLLHVPPLRDRSDDIRILAEEFIKRAAQEHGSQMKSIADETLSILRRYPWPGNVRQLFNTLGHALMMQEGTTILPTHLPSEIRDYVAPAPHDGAERRLGRERREWTDRRSRNRPLPPLETLEQDHIRRALMLTSGQIGRAADLLGIHRNTLRRKLRDYQLGTELQASESGQRHTEPDPLRA